MQREAAVVETGGGRLRIGTCSWKYDSWQGLVYQPGDQADYLRAYARRYGTVEVDQWFWSLHGPGKISLPRPEVVDEYRAAVPDDFRFSVKVPNSITLTHFYRRRPDETLLPNDSFLSLELWARFVERLAPLGDRLGPLMLQFEYLNRQKMVSQARFQEQLGGFLARCERPGPIAVEIRNPNYLNRSFFEFLRQADASPVFL